VGFEREQCRAERAEKKKDNVSWSHQTGRKEEKQRRKEKKTRKKKWLQMQQKDDSGPAWRAEVLKRVRTRSGSGGERGNDDEWAELAREERMAKKLRRGDITQDAFDEEFAQS